MESTQRVGIQPDDPIATVCGREQALTALICSATIIDPVAMPDNCNQLAAQCGVVGKGERSARRKSLLPDATNLTLSRSHIFEFVLISLK
jgi:hypothetical protein